MALRIIVQSRRYGGLSQVTSNQTPPISALFPQMFKNERNVEKKSRQEEFIPGVGTPVSIDGFEPNFGKDHSFDYMWVRDVERFQETEKKLQTQRPIHHHGYLDKFVNLAQGECYQPASNVCLYSVMQTNVPEPYTNCGRPSHLNMPGGGEKLEFKYTSSKRNAQIFSPLHASSAHTHTISLSGVHSIFPTRSFSTSAVVNSQEAFNHEQISVPKFIVKENEKQSYLKWMDNNHKYGLDFAADHDKLSKGIISVAELIVRQEAMLADLGREFTQLLTNNELTYEGIQGPEGPQPWLENHTVESLRNLENPVPQGVQGLDCEHFKVWLDNCTKYQFLNCNEQLGHVREGRKTLGQVFEEQDRIIKQVVEDYKSGKIPVSNVNSQETIDYAVQVNMSQKDRLKRAVKEYGTTVIVFHIAIALTSLGGFYLAVSSGLDVVGLVGKIGVQLNSNFAAGASTFVIAYAVHKVFAPVRIAITLTGAPLIVRHLRRIGFLKVPKKSEVSGKSSITETPKEK